MSTARSKNVKTVAEFQRQPMEIVKQVRKTKQPVTITMQGKPGVVVVDAATYQQRIQAANLANLLEAGEQDVRAGRLRPADQVLKELGRAKKTSR
ncbi:MAG TPA: type II toxin-antitoxin system Phd/YefM family antitoxin [Pirellulales bacterium]|nr:type II toxin-antitoxin system Phd/YefM family antitoxin [Pirellulales bacterium]